MGPPDKWRLNNYEIRTFDGLEESLLIGQGQQLDTTINLRPGDFIDYQDQQSMLTTKQLNAYIDRQKSRGIGNTAKYEAELHRRTADSITIIILTIIGVAISGRKIRGGLGIHMAAGILLGAFYIIFSRFASVFAAGQALPVLFSIWMPNLFFGAVAIWLVKTAQK